MHTPSKRDSVRERESARARERGVPSLFGELTSRVFSLRLSMLARTRRSHARMQGHGPKPLTLNPNPQTLNPKHARRSHARMQGHGPGPGMSHGPAHDQSHPGHGCAGAHELKLNSILQNSTHILNSTLIFWHTPHHQQSQKKFKKYDERTHNFTRDPALNQAQHSCAPTHLYSHTQHIHNTHTHIRNRQ